MFCSCATEAANTARTTTATNALKGETTRDVPAAARNWRRSAPARNRSLSPPQPCRKGAQSVAGTSAPPRPPETEEEEEKKEEEEESRKVVVVVMQVRAPALTRSRALQPPSRAPRLFRPPHTVPPGRSLQPRRCV